MFLCFRLKTVEDRIFKRETLGMFDFKSTSQGTFVNQQIFTIYSQNLLKVKNGDFKKHPFRIPCIVT